MKINGGYHLTYCTNIHAEMSWVSLWEELKEVLPQLKEKVSGNLPMGLGLRISDHSCRELLSGDHLPKFKKWLDEKNIYVFTLNGFPYGIFHKVKVKDDVHKPDWNTIERVEYTKRLMRVLAVLLPNGEEGSISTSPVSYKPWFTERPSDAIAVFKNSSIHFAQVVEEAVRIKKDTGKEIYLAIEPEPDGLIENTEEVIAFFTKFLIPIGSSYLVKKLSVTEQEAEQLIRRYIRICYDVCHLAIEFENHSKAIDRLEKEGIRIGKIQISSALKAKFSDDRSFNQKLYENFEQLIDPVYLHQVGEKQVGGEVKIYSDLSQALKNFNSSGQEWRIHYHVPLFLESFGLLQSTQGDVKEVLDLVRKKKITTHLEVETYTWDILPPAMKTDLLSSIERELVWVVNQMKKASIEVNE